MNKWIALITSLPTENATARMRAWRSLKASGAAVLRDGVYLMPERDACRLTLDPARRLAFITCEGNARLLVVDLQTMAVLSSHPVGANPDVLAFDPGLDRLYVASESGVISVFSGEATGFQKIGEGQVAPHAHSIAVDRETHRVYLPIENVDKHPVLRVMEPAH